MLRGSRDLGSNNLFLPYTNTNVRKSGNFSDIPPITDENNKNQSQVTSVRSSIKVNQRASVLAGNLFELLKKGSSGSVVGRKKNSLFGELIESKQTQNNLDGMTQEQLLDVATTILQKPFKARTQADIKTLTKCTENVKFFQEMISNNEKEVHEQCCKYMSVMTMEKDDVVMEEGSFGSRFYIILNGSVDVLKYKVENKSPDKTPLLRMKSMKYSFVAASSNTIPLQNRVSINTNYDSPESPVESPRRRRGGLSPDLSPTKAGRVSNKLSITWQLSAFDEHSFELNTATKKNTSTFKNTYHVKTLEAGSAFGELSLLENKPRQATIICKSACWFAILEKGQFKQILRDREQKKLFENINFLAAVKILKQLSYNMIKKLYYSSEELKLVKNEVVFKINDVANNIYVIKSGNFKIIQNLDEEVFQEYDELEEEIKQELNKPPSETQNSVAAADPHKSQERTPSPELTPLKYSNASIPGGSPLKKHRPKQIELAILGQGESFGEEEVITGERRRTMVICESAEGCLYVISKTELLRRLANDQLAKDNLSLQVDMKSSWRCNRLNEIKEANTKVPTTPLSSSGDARQSMTANRFDFQNLRGLEEEDKPQERLTRKQVLKKEKEQNDKRLGVMKDFLKKISGEMRSSHSKNKKSVSPLLLKAKSTKQHQSLQQASSDVVRAKQGLSLTQFERFQSSEKGLGRPQYWLSAKDLEKEQAKPFSKSRPFLNSTVQNKAELSVLRGKDKEDRRQSGKDDETTSTLGKKPFLNDSTIPYQLTTEGHSHTPSISSKSVYFGGYLIQSSHLGMLKRKEQFVPSKLPLLFKEHRSKTEANIEKTLSLLEQSWRESEEELGFPKVDLSKLSSNGFKLRSDSSSKLQILFETQTPRMREPKNFPGLFKGKPFRKLATNASLSDETKPEMYVAPLKTKFKKKISSFKYNN